MEEAKERLETWLRGELERADVDADVYVPYVAEFLEAGGAFDAAGAAEVLAAVMDAAAAAALAQRVGAQWRTEAAAGARTDAAESGEGDAGCLAAEMCEQLRLAQAEAAATAAAAAAAAVPGTEVVADSAERARLVAMYGAVVTEVEPAPGAAPAAAGGKKGRGAGAAAAAAAGAGAAEHLGGNVNHGVAQAAAERQRAEMKAAHDAKVEQDRKSREKQRLTREEKKAQRRAACQKGERRR